ncbi:MAG: arginine deiminase-related protein [Vampirovibrionales bacterium]|nr:arginine deiminase-related protein [Vampirovibrionales bacterium]
MTQLDSGLPAAATILMCPPDYFEVTYAINPWMTPESGCDARLAMQQWQTLKQTIESTGASVEILPPQPQLPDLVFTANAAFVYNNTAIVASYKHPERQPEEAHAEHWFKTNGFDTHRVQQGVYFEGAGDALIWRHPQTQEKLVFAGYRSRTDIASHAMITELTGLPVLALELANPKFYHIDVTLCPTQTGHLIYWPGAFDDYGRQVIESHVPEQYRIVVDDDEAARFACNTVSINEHVIFNQGSVKLAEKAKAAGLTPHMVDLSEFLKAGGSSKCLTLHVGR